MIHLIQEFVEHLCRDLDISPVPKKNERKTILFQLAPDIAVELQEINPGIFAQGKIAICPARKREELFLLLMRANFLGQGTGGAKIGLDGDEKFLTLSWSLPYEMSYQAFKENMEDFVNYLLYWRQEIGKFESS